LGLCAVLASGLAGCKDLDQCEDPGATEVCMCGDDPGARVCQPEYVWSDCDCGATVPDSGVTGGMGGMTGGMGGMTGGMGGMTGGMGGMTGGTGGMTGGTGGMTGGMGGMTGGMGGDAPDGGGGTGGDPMADRYTKCTAETAAADCGSSSECRVSDPPFGSFEGLTICAPACAETDDCPAPPAAVTGMVECISGQCVLSCSSNILMPVECATGLACATKDAVESCYHEAM
jgi:hypothetical protein